MDFSVDDVTRLRAAVAAAAAALEAAEANLIVANQIQFEATGRVLI